MSTSAALTQAARSVDKIPVLTEETFHQWEPAWEMLLPALGADYVCDSTTTSVPADSAALDKGLVFSMWSTIAPELQYLAQGKKSAWQVWKDVREHFTKSNLARRFRAREALYQVVHDPSRPMDLFLHDVDRARAALKGLGVDINDKETADVILMRLDPSYNTVRTSLTTQKTEPTLEDIKSTLNTQSAVHLAADPVIKTEPGSSALKAHVPARDRNRDDHKKRSSSPSRHDGEFRWCDPTNEGSCFRCGRPGHVAALCIADMPQHVKDWVMNRPYRDKNSSSTETASAHQAYALSARARPSSPSPPGSPIPAHIAAELDKFDETDPSDSDEDLYRVTETPDGKFNFTKYHGKTAVARFNL